MGFARRTPVCLAALAALAIGCNRTEPPLTPEAASAKGDKLLREMSTNLSARQVFAYTSDERKEVVGPDGKKTERKSTRHVTIRRPNGVTLTGSGDRGDMAAWYDGKHLTVVASKDKVWARGPMPPTLDEALDFLAAEYDIQVPSADLLYSNPYEALMTKDTTGGWVDVQKIGNVDCDHLSYHQELVDWELWLGPNRGPRQFKITYKKDPGQPSTIVTYHDLETPQVTDEAFVAKIPDGYQRIKIMRHATVNDPNVEEAPTAPAPPAPPKKK